MTRPPVDVRQAGPGDADDLLGLWVQARAEVQGAGRPLLGPVPELLRPRLVDTLARRGDVHILLARWEGRPAGFALVRVGQLLPVLEGDCVQLEHLFVSAGLRRHGIAKALLAGVAGLAERSGADQILSGAPPSAREVHRFLARLGFTPLVLRRVVATSTLRRRLAGESKRSALEDLLSRRRSLRARAVRAATPPHGLALDVAGAPVADVDLPPPSVADTLELEVQLDSPLEVQIEAPPADAPVIVPVPATPRRTRRRVAAAVGVPAGGERVDERATERATSTSTSA